MHIVITGAGGYIGHALSSWLSTQSHFAGRPITRLSRTDLTLPPLAQTPAFLHDIEGDLCQAALREQLLSEPADYVFHLAGITSKRAEEDLALSLAVNLQASVALFEDLRQQSTKATVVFTSSIGVFGTPLPDHIDDHTTIQPTLSYGTHKRMVELLIADYSRLGHLDGRAVRLPGIIARPLQAIAALSSFSSDLVQHLAAGTPYTCPVSKDAANWLISLPCCLQQLLHAALSPAAAWPTSRVVTLPALRVLTGELVRGLVALYGAERKHLVSWQPNAQIEVQFGCWPTLDTALADQLGFTHDHNVETLLHRALLTTPSA